MKGPFALSRVSGAKIPRPVTAPVKTATVQPPTPSTCPRCLAGLTDPDGLGLCPRCGYCHSLEEAPSVSLSDQATVVEAAPSNNQVVLGMRAVGQLPLITWPILLGCLSLLPLCYFADRRLLPDSRERALWCVGQLLYGLATVFVAQVWAFCLLRWRREEVGIKDIFFPANLWRLTCMALPGTGGALSLGATGCLAIFTALIWIGGWWYWVDGGDTEPDMPTTRRPTAAGRDWRDQYQLVKKATARVTNGERDESPDTSREVILRDSRPVTECVVIGYVPGEDGQLAGLVLGTLRDGQLTYAGTVTSGISKEQSAALAKKLQTLGSKAPPFATDLKARWVRPAVFCEVHQSGYNDKGLLIAPNFKGLIEE